MRKRADYIQSIEIKALWKGGRHIIWHLQPDVNILSGINGVGFDMDANRELSYGLNNIEERVDDMAGTLTLLSQKGKGVSMDIRLPLVGGKSEKKNDPED